jgi:hypothetical protein
MESILLNQLMLFSRTAKLEQVFRPQPHFFSLIFFVSTENRNSNREVSVIGKHADWFYILLILWNIQVMIASQLLTVAPVLR